MAKKKKKGKAKYFFILLLLILATGAFFWYRGYLKDKQESLEKLQNSLYLNFKDIETIEYDLSTYDPKDLIEDYSVAELTYQPQQIDLSILGVYHITYTLRANDQYGQSVSKDYSKSITVVDTKYPIIELKNDSISLTVGDSYDPKNNVEKAYDIIDGELEFSIDSSLDTSKAGDYTIQVKTTDSNGNVTTKSFKVTVVSKTTNNSTTKNNSTEKSYNYTSQELEVINSNMPDDLKSIFSNMKGIPELPSLIVQEDFITQNLPRYLLAMRNNKKTASQAISYVNNNEDYIAADKLNYSSFYSNSKQLTNYTSYTACVNKQNYLPSKYEPSDLTYLPAGYYGNKQPLRKVAADAFVKLADACEKAGKGKMVAHSNYRSYSYQTTLYNNYVSKNGKTNADKFSARPGYSEHQTGLVSDFAVPNGDYNKFASFTGYDWVMENAHKYGFIQRYPQGKEYITGYTFESWHFRYVGVQPATIMYEYGWTLDEYVLLFN